MGLGLALIVDLMSRARDLRAHYTYWGVLPQPTGQESVLTSWLHLVMGTVWFQLALFLFTGLTALALVVGYKTRFVTLLSWGLLFFIQTRNLLTLQAGDNLLLFLFFWSLFLPLGARYSFDAAMDQGRTDAPNPYFSMGTLAILLQVSCLYFFSALQKQASDAWIPDGTILHYVFHYQA